MPSLDSDGRVSARVTPFSALFAGHPTPKVTEMLKTRAQLERKYGESKDLGRVCQVPLTTLVGQGLLNCAGEVSEPPELGPRPSPSPVQMSFAAMPSAEEQRLWRHRRSQSQLQALSPVCRMGVVSLGFAVGTGGSSPSCSRTSSNKTLLEPLAGLATCTPDVCPDAKQSNLPLQVLTLETVARQHREAREFVILDECVEFPCGGSLRFIELCWILTSTSLCAAPMVLGSGHA